MSVGDGVKKFNGGVNVGARGQVPLVFALRERGGAADQHLAAVCQIFAHRALVLGGHRRRAGQGDHGVFCGILGEFQHGVRADACGKQHTQGAAVISIISF